MNCSVLASPTAGTASGTDSKEISGETPARIEAGLGFRV